MSADQKIFGGAYRDVLENENHTVGLDRGALEILSHTDVGPTLMRIVARLDHPMPSAAWAITNPTIRLEIPGDGDELVSRVYTVREFHDAGTERQVVVDVIRHDHDSPMMRWTASLTPGDTVAIIGPREHFAAPFVAGRETLLFADESAIPALATILRVWPTGHPGRAWVEARDRRLLDELFVSDTVVVSWVPAGTQGLAEAAHAASGTPTVWAAGERDEMREVRAHFRRGLSLPAAEAKVFGYWKRGISNSTIDRHRLEHFSRVLADGGAMESVDDLDIAI